MKPPILSKPIAETEPLCPSADPFACSNGPQPAPDARPAAARSAASLDTRLSTPDTSPRPSVPSSKKLPSSPVKAPGRPTLFTDALVDKICDYIQNTGVSDSAAGLLAGVSTSTLSRWKAEKPDFALLLEAARAELQRELITAVREARRRDGSSDWRGAAWLLERLFPEDFGRRPRSKAQRQNEAPVDFLPTTGRAPVLPAAPAPAAQPTAARGSTVEPTTALDPEPCFPRPVPPAHPEPRFPKPTPLEPSPQFSPEPIPSDAANLPETPVLPTPGRFRCRYLSNRLIAAVRDRGAEPAETLQLFPKCPAAPFPPSLNPAPATSILVPKPNPIRLAPLAGPLIPPAVTVATNTAF